MSSIAVEGNGATFPIDKNESPRTMKRVVQELYGSPDVLELERTPIPEIGDDQLLIQIHATSVTATESVFRQGKPLFSRLFTGFRKPKVQTLGEEMAGRVMRTGKNVTEYEPGDMIFGSAGPGFGAAAEYLAVSADGAFIRMPKGLTPAEAAGSVDGFLTALPFLRDVGAVKPGQRVLINGASGSVGAAAVQVAKYLDAEVTAICSGRNIDFVKNLGADHVVDYTAENFPDRSKRYDVIFDAVGKISFRRFRELLVPRGLFLEAGMNMSILLSVLASALFGGKKAKIAATGLRSESAKKNDLKLLKDLMEAGTIVPTIDRSYSIDEIREAHRYVDTGRKRGNVVISVLEADTGEAERSQ